MYLVADLLLVLCIINEASGTISWPKGNYALLQPTTGCPAGWQDNGWILQDTEDSSASNNRSESLHINGFVWKSEILKTFCVKMDSGTSTHAWPPGKYCIYKKDNCPSGMKYGSIKWDDENSSNRNAYKGTLPVVDNSGKNMRLFFCCKTTGTKTDAIELPTTRPFYLLAYGSPECQQVKWAVVTSEWIKYDTEQGTQYNRRYGKYPFDGNKRADPVIYYCYYEECKYNLNTTEGIFQSPRFPQNYPDGQLCSWRITVPDGQVITVEFTDFFINGNTDNDYLEFYDGEYETSPLINSFNDDNKPTSVTSVSHVLFIVFRSNEVNNGKGFRAKYKAINIQDLATTTTKPNTMTSLPRQTTHAHAHTTMTIPTQPQHAHTTMTTTTQAQQTTHEKSPNETSTLQAFKQPCSQESEATPVVAIVVPLACFIVVLVLVVDITYRLRTRRGTPASEKNSRLGSNPTYGCGEVIIPRPGNSTEQESNYQDTSPPPPEYQTLDYQELNGFQQQHLATDYQELETVHQNAEDEDELYHVLEGPEADEENYQAINVELSSVNPIYQSGDAQYSKRNQLYGSRA